MIAPTPHDIAALAETRRRDPDLALSIAEQSGKAHDQSMTSRICGIPETENSDEPDSSNRISTVLGSSQDEPSRLRVAGNDATPAVVEVPKLGFGG